MSDFFMDEGSLELDDGWDDRTVTALTFPAGSQKPEASLSVTRDPLRPGLQISLAGYVDEQLTRLAKSCQQFRLIERQETTIGDLPAELVEFVWKTPDGFLMHQIQAVLILTGKVMVLTGTAQSDKYAGFSDIFQQMIMSFRPR
ncbi:MAG TPA: DcrB-related protein [Blastocatellia bacterium]